MTRRTVQRYSADVKQDLKIPGSSHSESRGGRDPGKKPDGAAYEVLGVREPCTRLRCAAILVSFGAGRSLHRADCTDVALEETGGRMHQESYRETPVDTDRMPPGIGNILVNEAAERFAFYGFNAILAVFMTEALLGADGALAVMDKNQAVEWQAWFKAATYAMALVGAIMADVWLAKYRTIIWFSILYCAGFVALVVDQTRIGLFSGLALIAVGSGMIKPCVQANVGDQFGARNEHFLSKVYAWFYFAINVGACASMLSAPLLRKWCGFRVAFGVSAGLMGLALVVFWMGRKKYAHVPPAGASFVRECFTGEGLRVIGRLSVILILVAVFWSLFDQTLSAWVLQAKNMNLRMMGIAWLPDQLTSVNSALILVMIPLFNYVVYPVVNRICRLTPLRKIGIGLFLGAGAFSVSALIEQMVEAGSRPTGWWQILAYIIMTAAEVMVSITFLEFCYTQAPKRMKSFISSFYLLSIALGNALTGVVNRVIQNPDGTSKLPGASYYWFFVWVMLGTAVVFVPVAMLYRGKTYTQDESNAA